jgi:sugar phosphate isomerase/epimerase
MDIEPVPQAVAAAGYDGIDISATWQDDLDPARMPSGARDHCVKAAGRLGLEVEAVVTHLGLVQVLPWTVHVHVKDWVGRYPDFEHRIPGEGELDRTSCLRVLKGAGYDGHVVNECFIDAPLDRACSHENGFRRSANPNRAEPMFIGQGGFHP